MSYIRFILLLYGFFAVFVAGGLYFRPTKYGSRWLSLFILVISLEIFEFLYSTSKIAVIYPQFSGIAFLFMGYLYGPFLYFHLRKVLYEGVKFQYLDLLHFLPIIIALVYSIDIIKLSPLDRVAYLRAHFYDRIMPMNYIRAIHILIYGVSFTYLLVKRFALLEHQKKLYSLGMVVIYFLSASLVTWLTGYADNWRQFVYFYITICSLLLIISYLLFTEPSYLKEFSKKYLSSSLTRQQKKEIINKLSIAMNENLLFLKNDLTLTTLAESIAVKPHHITQALSTLEEINYNDYINSFRIKHSQKLLLDKKFNHYKIEAIGLDSGFNNKVTFNRAFSKFTGLTPKEYRNKFDSN